MTRLKIDRTKTALTVTFRGYSYRENKQYTGKVRPPATYRLPNVPVIVRRRLARNPSPRNYRKLGLNGRTVKAGTAIKLA